MLCYSCNKIAFNLLLNVIEEYKNFIKYHCDVYTKNGEYIFNSIIKYELQKLLYKIDHDEYDEFSYNKLQ